MKASNKLTLYILVAMLLGAVVGYLIFVYGKGDKLTYQPTKDFTGADRIVLAISGKKIQQNIFVVSDSVEYIRLKDSIHEEAWIILKNSKESYQPSFTKLHPETNLQEIVTPSSYGSAYFTSVQSFSDNIKLLTTIFLRLVQMIIAPLVFSTLVVGIAKLGDLKTVGRVGGKALLWFISASLMSLLLGMFLVNASEPGVGFNLSNASAASIKDIQGNTQVFTLQHFVEHVVPKSLIEAMANNEILQIVIFSIFFGVATAALGDYGKVVVKALDAVSHVILKMVNYVMKFAPFGVFGAIAGVIATNGLGIFAFYLKYFSFFLLGIALLWVLLCTAGFLILQKRLPGLLKHIVQPLVIAFSTTSSEAVFPRLTEELEKFGCKDKIVAFVLPLGYSFNLDGSMMYMTFASLAIAQAYGIQLDLGTQLTMLLVLMLTSKGIAGVPRASLVVVLATCSMFKIPPEGVALILPIDHFCDMFRSMTNVLGNALATSAVSKWEGALEGEKEAVV